MSTVVAPSEETGAIPPVPISPLAAPPIWTCPTADCQAMLPSVAFLAEHLEDWHGWTEDEVARWWTAWLADRWLANR